MTEPPELVRACPACGKESPVAFAVCWNCQADLSNSPFTQVRINSPSSEGPAAAHLASRLPRRVMRIELLIMLLVTWLPVLASGIQRALAPPVSPKSASPAWTLLEVGLIALFGYLIWRDRGTLAPLGVTRVVWWREIIFAAGLVVAAWSLAVMADLLAQWVDLPIWDNDFTARAYAGRGPYADMALLVAVSFEEVQRVYVLTRLEDLGSRPQVAVIISALLFALAHVYSPTGTLSVLFFGLLFGGVFSAARRLPRLVLAHWVSDLIILGWFR